MTALSLVSFLSFFAQIGREPDAPFRLLLRTTGQKLRPANPVPFAPRIRTRQDQVLQDGRAGLHHAATVLWEERSGALPTVVIGGFVPDATEAAYLLRGGLLQQGSLYYINYPRGGFSAELIFAQVEDLVEEIGQRHGCPPVLLAVSFGAGLALELLRRTSAAGRPLPLAGTVLISPVACLDDLLEPGAPKPTTLLGRAVKPYLDAGAEVEAAVVEKSRAIFQRMFDSGAQNRDALRLLLTRAEVGMLRDRVLASINSISVRGAIERVRALRDLPAPGEPRVLCHAPTLILFSEKEGAVLCEGSPTRRELGLHPQRWFPQGRTLVVANRSDNPVQHASLIFHARYFQPPLAAFYRRLRAPRRRAA